MQKGFVKLHRKLTEWEWYSDINTLCIFVHMLLVANHSPSKYKGHTIKRGQLVFGRKKIAEKFGLSEQQVRTVMDKLKSTNEITSEATNKFSIVTLVNYDLYQNKKEKTTNKTTNKTPDEQPTNNQQVTTSKEVKKLRIKEISSAKNLQEEKKPNAWAIWVDVNRECGRSDPFPSGKDTKTAKSILDQIRDAEKYADILRQYLADNDKFLQQNGHGLSFISSRINKYLNESCQPYEPEHSPELIAEIMRIEEEIEREAEQKKNDKKST